MKRKLLTILLSIIAALCLCLGLVACDKKNDDHGSADQNTDSDTETDLWTVERLYAEAQAKGFEGSLDDLIALFKGDTGAQGPKGDKGTDGKDGIGVKSVEIDENGHLKITLTDGTILDAGKVTADGTTEDEGTEGLQFQKIKGDGEYTLALVGLGNAWDTDIVIPSTYRGLKVTAIADKAFSAESDARNANLTSITIPDSVTKIGREAFSGCSSLESMTLADGSKLGSIGDYAFDGCNGLTGVYVADLAAWCKIDFGNGGSNPLIYACHLYVDHAELKEFTVPGEITEIKPYAFYNCSSLESITIPDGVTSVGVAAFCWCSRLTSVTIGSGVTRIGNSAFYNCSLLSSITIPDSVTSIGEGAFEKTAYYNDQSNWDPSGVLYIGNHLTDAKSDVISGSYSVRANTKTIAGGTFSGCSSLESITIPDGVISIGYAAFYECGSLQSISIPDGVTSIGEAAFEYCSGLTSITIPDSVTSIGDWAFTGCSGLTNITIPDGVTSIGNGVFGGCSLLSSITIPDSVISIGEYVFHQCSSLTSISIPDSVTSIGDWAFSVCSLLTDIQFKGKVEEWQAIKKSNNWNSNNANYTITCTDGTIDKDGNVTYFAQ